MDTDNTNYVTTRELLSDM